MEERGTRTSTDAATWPVTPVQAVFCGFACMALANAVGIARLELPDGGLGVRALHHVIELGHTLALGTLVAAGVALVARFGPARFVLRLPLLWIAAAAAAQVVLVEDLEGPLERLGGDPENALALGALALLVATAVPAAFALGQLAARPRVRWAAVLAGAGLAFANGYVLPGGYAGAHLLLGVTGATLVAASLAGAPGLKPRFRTRRWVLPAAWSSAVLAGALAVLLKPSSAVQVELQRFDAAVIAPWLGEYHATRALVDVDVPDEMKPWFERRKRRTDVEPHSRRLLPEGPIVVLFSIDAFRHDLMNPEHREVAPNIHAMRESSIYFSQARSFGAGTRISLSALFTGRYYSMLEWTKPLSTRPTLERDKLPRFPELLQRAGVDTVNLISLPEMLTNEIGVVRGFSEEILRNKKKGKLTGNLTNQAIARLKKQGKGPLFLFMHVIDPHAPYRTYGKKVSSKREAYHLEVTLVDRYLGKLRRAIKELGLERRTALIVTSDHGEGFGENGVFYHNKTVYDVMVHVPLLIEIGGLAPRVIDDYVSVMDLGPTILDLFGVPTPGYWMAESLVPQLAGEPGPKGRPLVMETRFEHGMLFPDGKKAIIRWRTGTEEIYDLERDPRERKNLRDALGAEGDHRIELLRAYLRIHAGRRQNGQEF